MLPNSTRSKTSGNICAATNSPSPSSRATINLTGATGGTTHISSGTVALSETITAVNDSPIASGSATLAAINEDAATPAGATVTSLFSGNFSDATDQVSGGSSANTLAGIAIRSYTVDATKGNWQYSTNGGGSWTSLGNETTSAALTLNASDMLRFVPAANYNGSATALSANLIESGQTITSGATINLTGATGGTTHISSGTVALSETINSVNDAPSGSGNSLSIKKDTTGTFNVAEFNFSDIDGNSLLNVIIGTINAGAGNLQLNGSNVTANQIISVADINAGNLKFVADSGNGKTGNFTFQLQDNGGTANGGSDTSGSYTMTIATQNGAGTLSPAGVAGEAINLALTDPPGDHIGAVTLTIAGLPSGWTLGEGAANGDGTWTVVTNDIAALTVTSPSTYTGALVLNVTETWTNADGSIGHATVVDNVEAYAPGSPIFALSGDDNLTGSSGHDLFVFSQPIGHDVIYSFDAASDQIDLIGYADFTGFGDIQAHMANDAAGNAVITLADGQSITLNGVDAASLTASDFVFDQTPVTENAGHMVISDGAILPLSGIIDNTGTIELNSTGSETDLELIEHGITLQGHGQVVLSDSSRERDHRHGLRRHVDQRGQHDLRRRPPRRWGHGPRQRRHDHRHRHQFARDRYRCEHHRQFRNA